MTAGIDKPAKTSPRAQARRRIFSGFLGLSLTLAIATSGADTPDDPLVSDPGSDLAAPDDEVPEALDSDDEAREALLGDVRAYQRLISDIEAGEGAYALGLTEHLLGLGLALQRAGDHAQALEVFKRGVHLSRVNEGLYSTRQLALLQAEIDSHIALADFASADERQRYLYRVQATTLSDVTRGQALMQHALWQRQAYEVGVGDEPFARLTRMWSLYRLAYTEFAQAEGETSPLLLEPLYGMLRSQYMISGFVGETTSGRFRTRGVYSDEESQQIAYRGQSYKQGSAVISTIHAVQVAQPDASASASAEAILMLGDWQFWHGKRTEALETYASLEGELAADGAAQEIRERFFGMPQPLPAFAGVRAVPEPIPEREGLLLLEFGVSERGRITDVLRLDEYSYNDVKADELIRRLKQTLFRPRISDGLPVATSGLRWAWDASLW